MNLMQLSDEFVINLDHVSTMSIIDVPDEKGNICWAILFQLNLIDSVKTFANSPDEEYRETSHNQLREYSYSVEISPLYKTIQEAKLVLKRIADKFTTKKEKSK